VSSVFGDNKNIKLFDPKALNKGPPYTLQADDLRYTGGYYGKLEGKLGWYS
jgi:hypothetical protein